MRIISIIALLLIAGNVVVFAQEKPTANCEFASVVTADGVADEWPVSWIVDEDKIFSYNICSDNNNLYIRMKTSDELTRRKIGYFGFTVWLDPNGKKKRKIGLKFPSGVEAKERMDRLRATEDQRKNMSGSERDKFIKDLNKSMIADLEVLELIGLADDPISSTRTGLMNGIKVAIDAPDDFTYVYEAIIPFKAFRLSKANISEMQIGLETGKFVPPPQKNSAANNGGNSMGGTMSGSGMGMGMGMGGGMGGQRMRSGGGYPSSPLMQTTNTWVRINFKQ